MNVEIGTEAFSGNICFEISVFCLCSVDGSKRGPPTPQTTQPSSNIFANQNDDLWLLIADYRNIFFILLSCKVSTKLIFAFFGQNLGQLVHLKQGEQANGMAEHNRPEMEFLDINLTKDSSLLLHSIHSPFYRRILKKTILFSGFKNHSKKSAKQENSSLFMNNIL
jgi:hypothetical protein